VPLVLALDQGRGAIFGLTRGTTKAHLVRAALEAMAYSTREVLDAMAADAKIRPDAWASQVTC